MTTPFLASRRPGEWAFDRDVENRGRGDPGSIDARVQSIKRSAFIENRGGPWCFAKSDAKIVDRYDVAHQATLLDGGKKLWKSDPNHSSLKKVLKHGMKHSKIYVRRTPRFARRWITERGNAEADVQTATTPLQLWESAGRADEKFELVKDEPGNKWTVRGLGSFSLYEDKKYEVGRLMHPGRWPMGPRGSLLAEPLGVRRHRTACIMHRDAPGARFLTRRCRPCPARGSPPLARRSSFARAAAAARRR